ncbi:hypothetical protein PR048_007480 [Dryococelus australis]|uniref:Uncharacterized protein n=1 Tax=Dryococelus australis TaxID=614101 RepID=A0ABQ9HVA6_9NEOP|nr:hypothetical protein PR048_007480 [Dryococelus australis]
MKQRLSWSWVTRYSKGMNADVFRSNTVLLRKNMLRSNYLCSTKTGKVTLLKMGAAVAERIHCSPPTKANRARSPAGATPGLSHVESVSDDAAGDLPFPPPLHSKATPYSPRFTLIGSQGPSVKSCPHLFTHSTDKISCWCSLLAALGEGGHLDSVLYSTSAVRRASTRRCRPSWQRLQLVTMEGRSGAAMLSVGGGGGIARRIAGRVVREPRRGRLELGGRGPRATKEGRTSKKRRGTGSPGGGRGRGWLLGGRRELIKNEQICFWRESECSIRSAAPLLARSLAACVPSSSSDRGDVSANSSPTTIA